VQALNPPKQLAFLLKTNTLSFSLARRCHTIRAADHDIVKRAAFHVVVLTFIYIAFDRRIYWLHFFHLLLWVYEYYLKKKEFYSSQN